MSGFMKITKVFTLYIKFFFILYCFLYFKLLYLEVKKHLMVMSVF